MTPLDEYLKALVDEKTTRAGKIITPDKTKYAICPYCKRRWLTSVKGGGMIVQAANRHVKACAKKHGVEV
jgi:hypothetical protein